MSAGSISHQSLEKEILVLIGDHILELRDGFACDENLFDAGLDSMAIMQLLLVIDEHLSVDISVSEVTKENFRSVQSIAALVIAKQYVGSCDSGDDAVPKPAAAVPDSKAPAQPPQAGKNPGSDYEYPAGKQLAALTESDCFVRANERVMAKTGQGLHIVSSVLHLDALPDIGKLRMAMVTLPDRHPILSAGCAQSAFSTPVFLRTGTGTAIPFDVWYEEGSAGRTREWAGKSLTSAHSRLEYLTNLTEAELQKSGHCHVRCDLIELKNDGCLFVLTWRHIILDGVGAELFLQEINHAVGEVDGMSCDALTELDGPPLVWRERLTKARPITSFFNRHNSQRYRSLAGKIPAAGALRFEVMELTSAESRRVFERGEQLCGPVMTTPFHAACAIRAHELVWRYRRQTNINYMVTVPIQTRRKGATGPIFQNHLTMLFLTATQEEAGSLATLVQSLSQQQERYSKDKLGASFKEMQGIMRYMPPWLYTAFIRWHMRGEMTSFFFSGTGTFAPSMSHFAGAKIRNAYHIPAVNRPPGTGLFINDKNGIVTAVMSYREGVLNEDEISLLRDGFVEGLVGEWPNDSTRALRDQIQMGDDPAANGEDR